VLLTDGRRKRDRFDRGQRGMNPDHVISLFVLLLALAGVGAGVIVAFALAPRWLR
jgi:hypothetical protein